MRLWRSRQNQYLQPMRGNHNEQSIRGGCNSRWMQSRWFNKSTLERKNAQGLYFIGLNWRKGEGVGLRSSPSRLIRSGSCQRRFRPRPCGLILASAWRSVAVRPLSGFAVKLAEGGGSRTPPSPRNGDRQVLKTCRATGPLPLPFPLISIF